MNRYKSRKFIVTLLCGFGTGALCWFDKIDAGVYSAVMIATVGVYVAGNVWQKKVAQ
jgi:hypothetical protein